MNERWATSLIAALSQYLNFTYLIFLIELTRQY
jgi:hypothetical protein